MFEEKAIHALRDAAMVVPKPIETPDGGTAVVTPQGFVLHKIPPVDPLLTHVKQKVIVHDRASLINYVNDFKTPVSRIFAEPGFLAASGKATVLATLDYHEKSAPIAAQEDLASEGIAPSTPNYGAHRIAYMPRYSEAWTRWGAACAKSLTQFEFAELIEECRGDIVEPHAADLLDMVATFKASKKVEFDSVTYQRDSSVKLSYSDTVEKAGSTSMPEKLKLGIPVYYRGDMFEVEVWIRFKVGDGGVKFALKLDRADRIEDEAFDILTQKIVEATNVPLHMGSLA